MGWLNISIFYAGTSRANKEWTQENLQTDGLQEVVYGCLYARCPEWPPSFAGCSPGWWSSVLHHLRSCIVGTWPALLVPCLWVFLNPQLTKGLDVQPVDSFFEPHQVLNSCFVHSWVGNFFQCIILYQWETRNIINRETDVQHTN